MAVTHKLIQTITVGSGGAATIDFTSIPATYTDLVLYMSARSTDLRALNIKFNNTSTTYTVRHLDGDGASATSNNYSLAGDAVPSTATASVFGNNIYYIPNYAGSNQKSYSVDSVTENNGTTAYQHLTGGLWNGTSAITQITFNIVSSGNFAQYSSASLYGIKNS
jgi:hypothetical protein